MHAATKVGVSTNSNFKQVGDVLNNTTKSKKLPWFDSQAAKTFSNNSKYFYSYHTNEKDYKQELINHLLQYDIHSSSKEIVDNPIISSIIKDREDIILNINKFFNYASYVYSNMDKTKTDKQRLADFINKSKGYLKYMNKVFLASDSGIRKLLIEKIEKNFVCQSKGIKQLIDEKIVKCPITLEEIDNESGNIICILSQLVVVKEKDFDTIKLYRTAYNLEGFIENYKYNSAKGLHPSIKEIDVYFDTSLKEKFAEKSLDSLIVSLEANMALINSYTELLRKRDIEESIIDVIEKLSTLEYELEKYLEAKNLGHLLKKIDQEDLRSTFKIKNLNSGLSLARELARMDKYVNYAGALAVVFVALGSVIAATGKINNFTVSCMGTCIIMSTLLIFLLGYYICLIVLLRSDFKADPENRELLDAFASIS